MLTLQPQTRFSNLLLWSLDHSFTHLQSNLLEYLTSNSCSFPHLVELVGVLSDKGSVENLTLGRADHKQLPHLRRTCTQAVMTLKEDGEGRETGCRQRGRRWRGIENVEETERRKTEKRQLREREIQYTEEELQGFCYFFHLVFVGELNLNNIKSLKDHVCC